MKVTKFGIGLLLGSAMILLLASCSGSGGAVRGGAGHFHHGWGPWWRGGGVYIDSPIIIDGGYPDVDLPVEPTPLPLDDW